MPAERQAALTVRRRATVADEAASRTSLQVMPRAKTARSMNPFVALAITAAGDHHVLAVVTGSVRNFAGTGVLESIPSIPSPVTVVM